MLHPGGLPPASTVAAQTKNYKIPLSTAAYLSRYSDQSIGRSTFMGTGMGTDLRRDLRGVFGLALKWACA